MLYDPTKIWHIVCFSGGESSAVTAVEVVRRFGKENVLLVNHDINANFEVAEIKNFKHSVAAHLGVSITFVNYEDREVTEIPDQFTLCTKLGAIHNRDTKALCTYELKTKPFMRWLQLHFSARNCIIYYGFSYDEKARIQRRSSILGRDRFKTDYVCRWKVRTIYKIAEIGIAPPSTYKTWTHANCLGCLKGGLQYWYMIYCLHPDIFQRALELEDATDSTILRYHSMEECAIVFAEVQQAGFVTTEHEQHKAFWYRVYKKLPHLKWADKRRRDLMEGDSKPCECTD